MSLDAGSGIGEPSTAARIEPPSDRMRAVRNISYGAPDVLELTTVDTPMPGPDEVLIGIHAATVSAVDVTFRRGDDWIPQLFYTGLSRPRHPTLGTDLAGEVVAVGEAVDRFSVGDRVFGEGDAAHGTHAEYVCLPEDAAIVPMPSSLSFEEAAAFPYGALTALHFLRDAGDVRRGQQVLVNGASGAVGTAAVQLAKHMGAVVTGVCGSSNVELVRSLGADVVIDYTAEDFTENGETYDLVFDAVGKRSFAECRRSLRDGGTYLTTVLAPRVLLDQAVTTIVGRRRARIAFAGLRSAEARRDDLEYLAGLLESGDLRAVIDRRYSLSGIAEAHEYVEGGHKSGAVVVVVGDGTDT